MRVRRLASRAKGTGCRPVHPTTPEVDATRSAIPRPRASPRFPQQAAAPRTLRRPKSGRGRAPSASGAACSPSATAQRPAPRSMRDSTCCHLLAAVRRASSDACPRGVASGQFADRLLEQVPRLIAELAFPLRVETRLTQRRAKRIRRGPVDRKALALQIGDRRVVELAHIVALLQRALIERVARNALKVFRQTLPCARIQYEPVAVPHVIRQ